MKKYRLLAVLVGALVFLAACNQPGTTTPQQFSFTDVADAAPGAVVTSNAVTLRGFSGATQATVTAGGQLIVNGTAAGDAATVRNDDRLAVRVTASETPGESVTVTVRVGTVSDTFTVTTAEGDEPEPGAITFTPVVNAEPDTLVTSAPYVVAELDAPATATVDGDGDPVLIVNGDEAGAAASVEVDNDDELQVRLTSSPDFATARTATVTIGERTGTFTVTTRAETTDPGELEVCAADDEVITMDPSLEAAFREQFDFTAEEITCGDVNTITTFGLGASSDAPGGVTSLVGIQHFAALTTLDAQWNEIDDIAPVALLPGLERLVLDKNPVTDLTPITGHPNLTIFEAWDVGPVRDDGTDGLTDLAVLATIPSLEEVYISENAIDDLTPLASLPELRVLFANANEITDISPLAGLTNLQVLRLSGNMISDGSALAGLTNLAWLELTMNMLDDADLAPLASDTFANLFVVMLDENYFTADGVGALLDNTNFPAAEGAPGLPSYRQQPEEATVSFSFNCMTSAEADTLAAAFAAALVEVPAGNDVQRLPENPDGCGVGPAGLTAFQIQQIHQDNVQKLRETDRIR